MSSITIRFIFVILNCMIIFLGYLSFLQVQEFLYLLLVYLLDQAPLALVLLFGWLVALFRYVVRDDHNVFEFLFIMNVTSLS